MNTAALRIPPTRAAAPPAASAQPDAAGQLAAAYAALTAYFPTLSQQDICGARATLADIIGDLATEELPQMADRLAREHNAAMWAMLSEVREAVAYAFRSCQPADRHSHAQALRNVRELLRMVRRCDACSRPIHWHDDGELCPACAADLEHDAAPHVARRRRRC